MLRLSLLGDARLLRRLGRETPLLLRVGPWRLRLGLLRLLGLRQTLSGLRPLDGRLGV